MRVYQFRHIRVERQSSRSACPLPVSVTQHHVTRFSYVSPTMTALLRGLLIGLFCLLALASGAARAGEQPAASGELVEVVVGLSQQPLGVTRLESRTAAPIADAGLGAEPSRGHDRSTASRRADPLALQARRERDGRRRASLATRPPHRSAGCRQDLSERSLPAAARPQRAADRRTHALGIRARERRPGDEDRDHRRGNRPAAPVLLAGRVHDARRIPEGPDRLHDGQGHRRARVPARPTRPGRTRRSRSTARCRRTAHTSRASPPETTTPSPKEHGSPASRRARTSATTRR